jgi:glycosyltransferase involved in cell wall biosynthesis
MNLAFLAGASSIHTTRWVNTMAQREHKVTLMTLHPRTEPLDPRIRVHRLRFGRPWGYYLNMWQLSRLLRAEQPDLLHAHYATGYGTLARLVRFHPTLLSVWGSDVYDYPNQSPKKRRLVEKNLAAADAIASTSRAMKAQTEQFVQPKRPIAVTPFGVDLRRFQPIPSRARDKVRVGCMKKLEEWYGIDFLIQALRLLIDSRGEESIGGRKLKDVVELIIIGEGSRAYALKELARDLALDDHVHFVGEVPHSQVPAVLNGLDIFCVPTVVNESFGVVAVEAAACGLPVIASHVGGLAEVVHDGETGFLVPARDPHSLAERLRNLVANPELRAAMGAAGRRLVEQEYNWSKNADHMEALYRSILAESQGHRGPRP